MRQPVSLRRSLAALDVLAMTPPPFDALVEAARLAALRSYRTLDETDVAALSQLAAETAVAMGASHAAISFVDAAVVWFGGAAGFDWLETPRAGSFCDAVVRSGAPLLVPDALEDPRFWEHELVRGAPFVRGYAGAPLVDEGGYRLGAVAVYSPAPGVFDAATLERLVGLARIVRDFLAETRAAQTARGAIVQGWLGVRTLESDRGGLDDERAEERGRERGATGLLVLSVAKGSPADRAGLRPADLLHSIGDWLMLVPGDVTEALAEREYGVWLPIRYRRAGAWRDGDVQVRPRGRSG